MKKIICICICICLMSGCDKSLRHGRPANAVVEDKGSEGVPTHSLTSNTSASKPSNTPAPTPEPSKSALPSDTADTGSSVVKIVLCFTAVFALIVVTALGICRYSFPKEEDIDIAPYCTKLEYVDRAEEDLLANGYKSCYWGSDESISLVWCCFKKITRRWGYFDLFTKKLIKEIPIRNKLFGISECYYKPET
ncbi:hypothetical protein [Candidatus Endomicrobiellum agilis]|uniref:hypothetical protein n=1 Tax=Candidatus Endomicrobiellum agilis TaxID=3238957 RepID=UPI00357D1FEF|nr:hypothetical protein [Endomicrobium sp.]